MHGDRASARARTRPLALGAPRRRCSTAPDAEPDGIAYSWTDDARIMFTSGTTGRSKGVIKQNAADYFSARGLLEVVSATAGKRSSR